MNKTNFGAVMRRPLLFLSLLLLALVLLSGSAQAEVLRVTDFLTEYGEEPIEYASVKSVLVDSDTIHVVARVSTKTHISEDVCFEYTPEGEFVPCPYNCARRPASAEQRLFVHLVTPSGFTYGISMDGKIYRWTPGAEEPWQYLSENPTIDEDVDGYRSCGYVASDTALYKVYFEQETSDWPIIRYDVMTGEQKQLYVFHRNEQPLLFILPDGTLGTCRWVENVQRIRDDGKTEKLFEPEVPQGYMGDYKDILYLEGKGYLVLSDGALYLMDEEGKSTLLNYSPAYGNSNQGDGRNRLVYLPGHNAVGFVAYSGGTSGLSGDFVLNIISLTPQNTVRLQIGGLPLRNYDMNNRYATAYENSGANVKVTFPTEYTGTSFEKVAQQLVARNGSCDIFLVSTEEDGLQRMVQKGFYVPLDDVPGLAAFAETLYPAWRQEVTTAEGALAALPIAVGGTMSIACNPEVWEGAELGEKPATYAVLMESIVRWEDEGLLDDVSLFGYRRNSFSCLTEILLRANIAHYASLGETPVYDNETLLGLLRQLEEMRGLLSEYDGKRIRGDALLNMNYSAAPEIRYMTNGQTTLYLGFADAEDMVVPRTLYALVINPYSEHIEEAEGFLATAAEVMEDTTRFALQQLGWDCVELDGYEQSRTGYQEQLAESQAMLEEFQSAGNMEAVDIFQQDVESLQMHLRQLEEMHYDITPEAAAGYLRSMEHTAINRASGYALIERNASTAISSFVEGKTGAEELVRRLDEVVGMWLMEQE